MCSSFLGHRKNFIFDPKNDTPVWAHSLGLVMAKYTKMWFMHSSKEIRHQGL